MAQLAYLLPVLACSVGMGAMMWVMSRGASKPSDPVPEDRELATLRAEVAALRSSHHSPDGPGRTLAARSGS